MTYDPNSYWAPQNYHRPTYDDQAQDYDAWYYQTHQAPSVTPSPEPPRKPPVWKGGLLLLIVVAVIGGAGLLITQLAPDRGPERTYSWQVGYQAGQQEVEHPTTIGIAPHDFCKSSAYDAYLEWQANRGTTHIVPREYVEGCEAAFE